MILSSNVDYLNDKKTRNKVNTMISDYNCGGWALKTFSWYLPYNEDNHFDLAEELYKYGWSKEEVQEEILQNDFEILLKDFSDKLIPIDSIEDAKEGDTVIAYRLYVEFFDENNMVDTDFHFRVRENGSWTEKCGGGIVHPCLFTEEPWNTGGDCIYDSKILYFIFKDD